MGNVAREVFHRADVPVNSPIGQLCQWTFQEDAIFAPAVVRRYSSVARVIAAIATAPRNVPSRPAISRCVPLATAIKPACVDVTRTPSGNAVIESDKRK